MVQGAPGGQELLSRSQFAGCDRAVSVKLSACPLLEMVTGILDGVPEFDPCVAVKERLAGFAESSELPVTVIDTETVCESAPGPLPSVTVIIPE